MTNNNEPTTTLSDKFCWYPDDFTIEDAPAKKPSKPNTHKIYARRHRDGYYYIWKDGERITHTAYDEESAKSTAKAMREQEAEKDEQLSRGTTDKSDTDSHL